MNRRIFLFVTVLVIASLACSVDLGGQPQVIVVTPEGNQAPPPVQPVVPSTVPPTQTPYPTYTPPATYTPLPAPVDNSPKATADHVDVNCRLGPSTAYPYREALRIGQSAPIIGKSEPKWERWWLVRLNGINCWVSADVLATTGDTSNLPAIEAPPLPPTATATNPPAPEVLYTFTIENNQGVDLCYVNLKLGNGNWQEYNTPGWGQGGFWTFNNFPGGGYHIRIYDCAHNIRDNDSFVLDGNNSYITP